MIELHQKWRQILKLDRIISNSILNYKWLWSTCCTGISKYIQINALIPHSFSGCRHRSVGSLAWRWTCTVTPVARDVTMPASENDHAALSMRIFMWLFSDMINVEREVPSLHRLKKNPEISFVINKDWLIRRSGRLPTFFRSSESVLFCARRKRRRKGLSLSLRMYVCIFVYNQIWVISFITYNQYQPW